MFKIKTTFFLCLLCLGLTTHAEIDSTENQSLKGKKISVALTPLSALTGAYGTNIEYLIMEHKSIMAEGAYLSGITALEFLGKNTGSLGSLHFRHWFGQGFGSPFMGIFVRYAKIETLSHPKEDQDLTTKLKIVHGGLNYGQKYIFKNSFDFRFRVGYGFGLTEVEVASAEAEKDVINVTQAITKIFAGLDTEVGFGYCF
jgi:hypothetical protein